MRDGRQEHVVLHREGVGIFRRLPESIQERRAETVGHLQAHAQEEREDEEHGHARVLEQREGTQPEGVDERLALHVLVDGAVGQGERIDGENESPNGTHKQLLITVFVAREVDDPHREDETDGAEHADRREGLHRVQPGFGQSVVRYGVAQGDGRHEEGHAECIEREQLPETDRATVFHSHVTRQGHEDGGEEMADAQELLRRYPAVGHDTHQCGHEKGDDTLDGEEFPDVGTHADLAEIDAQGTEISSPHRKDEEVHHDKSEFDCFHIR